MPKPLRSDDPTPKDVQFAHFGLLNDGAQSKGAFATSIITNIVIAALVVVIGSVVKTKVAPPKVKEALFVPLEEKKPPPPKPPPPPKIQPPKIQPPKIVEPPKIQPPKVEIPPEIKPVVAPVPKVNLATPAPKKVDPPPAPKVVNLANASAAHVVNNDAHPSAVSLGKPDSPIKSNLTGPAVSNVRLGAGMAGMPASNTGNGPRATSVSLGSGSPQGTNLAGKSNAAVPVKGLANGVPGGTGTGAFGPKVVQIAPQQQQAAAAAPKVISVQAKPPVVTYIPKPAYSAEAKQLHLEGDAQVRVVFKANGTMEVVGIAHGLGHGLDQAALEAAQGIKFRPALDSG